MANGQVAVIKGKSPLEVTSTPYCTLNCTFRANTPIKYHGNCSVTLAKLQDSPSATWTNYSSHDSLLGEAVEAKDLQRFIAWVCDPNLRGEMGGSEPSARSLIFWEGRGERHVILIL